ncbi:Uma2 family endonuclease [Kibdelosporangium lantanae]|uniref:Uma2 family endonuclease n=1 Tax=Kibdelosporangium lantanae TaxID=1497396 RepID=A0ABW3MD80_9PSEU
MKHRPTHLYTVGEYAALGETEDRTELQEGIIVMSPSPSPVHMFAGGELFVQVRAQVPRNLVAIPEVDIDLGLAVLAGPGTVRRPDLVVVDEAAYEEWDAEGGLLRASDVRLVIEVVSPGSRRTDYVTKRSEYAEARIPHYWIVDIDKPVSMLVCELTEKGEYVDRGEVTGEFTADTPFRCGIDLTKLVRHRAGG